MSDFGEVAEYIDTVQFFFHSTYPPKEVTGKLSYLGQRLIIKAIDNGTTLKIQQPTIDNFKALEGHGAVITRIDFAVDLESSNSKIYAINISKTLKLKQTRGKYKGHKKKVVRGSVVYYRNSNSQRNIVIYGDRPSKITGNECVHIELRLKGNRTIGKNKIDLESIILGKVDTKELFKSVFKKTKTNNKTAYNAEIIKILEEKGYLEATKNLCKKRRLRRDWLKARSTDIAQLTV